MSPSHNRPRFPEQIETDRLIIRAPRPGDGAEVNAAILETYDDLHLWMEWADHIPSVAETEANMVRAAERFQAGEDLMLEGRLKTTGALVLCTGLHPRNWAVPKFEIGYWCRAGYQGQGYVAEAVRAITQVGFAVMQAYRIEIRCDENNIRSRRVAERTGFLLDATLRNDTITPAGELRTTLIYALLPEEYRALEST